jgi:hypothetical protein
MRPIPDRLWARSTQETVEKAEPFSVVPLRMPIESLQVTSPICFRQVQFAFLSADLMDVRPFQSRPRMVTVTTTHLVRTQLAHLLPP